ncbi:MAG: DUF7284 family protein [Halobacteriota archaeon]
MTSTAVDVTVCLLLVGAATATLVAIPGDEQAESAPDASEMAEVLATTTASVNYTLVRTARSGSASKGTATARSQAHRTDHGTLASLVAEATVVGVGREDDTAGTRRQGYRRAVEAAVTTAMPTRGVHVAADWRPYPNASIGGRLRVGPSPPPNRTVHAATLSLPSGMEQVRKRAVEQVGDVDDADDGYHAVAATVADAVVAGLYPPRTTAAALAGPRSVSVPARARYRRVGRAVGVTVDGELTAGDVSEANARLAEALAATIERELEDEYRTPRAAAEALTVSRVRIVVRTWS